MNVKSTVLSTARSEEGLETTAEGGDAAGCLVSGCRRSVDVGGVELLVDEAPSLEVLALMRSRLERLITISISCSRFPSANISFISHCCDVSTTPLAETVLDLGSWFDLSG